MEVTVENSAGLERHMKVAIPEERVEGEVSDRLRNMAQSVRIPGFRPGKVPLKVVAQRYGRQVRDEVVGEVVRSSFYDAVVQENLRPAGTPRIDEVESEPGQGVAYKAVFEVYPEVQMAEASTLKIKRPSAEVQDGDIDKMIETLRKQRRTWNPVERAAQKGDRVVLDFAGSVGGEPLENGSATEVGVELGSGQMMAGLENALEGASAGADLEVDVTLPETYRPEHLAGAEASFKLHVHTVQEPVIAEVNDEFMASFGVSEGGVDAFRAEVRNNMERELADALRGRTKQNVMNSLLEASTFELPNGMVQAEMDRLMAQKREELSYRGIDAKALELDATLFEPESRRRVALGLMLGEIVKLNEMKPDGDRVRARIDEIASTYDEPDKVVSWYYAETQRLSDVEAVVLEDQVVEWVLAQADTDEEQMSFDELLNPGQTTSQDSTG
jgi:trigger factor